MGRLFGSKADRYKNVINNFARFSCVVEDCELDLQAKESALKAARSVVCLRSYSGGEKLFICCGIIMDCEVRCGTSSATVLTAATLLRCPNGEAKLASDLKIDAYLVGGKFAEGLVVAVDFHYNIAIININSDTRLSIPVFRFVDDTVDMDSSMTQLSISHDYSSSSNRVRLYPGNKVLALARYFDDPYDIMVAFGNVRTGDCNFDCKQLLKASCKIKKNGIGGPLINLCGEVIGFNFYDPSFTPFLPMNIVFRCFEDLTKFGRVPRPWLGVVVRDLYSSPLHILENINNKFPHIVKGAIVEEVQSDSPSHTAGLCAGDVIINCYGAAVGSCLELSEILWDKEGKPIELVSVRPKCGKEMKFFVDAVKTNPTEYQWPVPERCVLRNHWLNAVIM